MKKNSKPHHSNTPPLRLEYRTAAELADNPANWRRHPAAQLNALRSLLDDPEIGWAGAALYNERTRRLIDGHARKSLRPDAKIPVLIGSWSEAAEQKILATLDPIAALAEADPVALESLLRAASFDEPELSDLLENLAQENDIQLAPEPTADATQTEQSISEQWLIIIECKSESQQTKLLKRLSSENLKCKALIS